MAILEVQNISKRFGTTEVLMDISFSLTEGESLAIIGSSGSGKTTLLRCLNFLERADGGRISVRNELLFDADDPATQKEREIRRKRLHFGMVFQAFNLFPQYTALQNVTLACELFAKEQPGFKQDKKSILEEIRQNGIKIMEQVGLGEKMDLYPHQLSGGQQQRVAIARALVTSPSIICLDEPLSNLDAKLRVQLRNELKDLQRKFGITTIYVTHDQEEALTLSDRIAVFNHGLIEQIGKPDEVYNHSSTEFVCNFIGDINKLSREFLERAGIGQSDGVDINKNCYIRLERLHVNDKGERIFCNAAVQSYEYYGMYIKYTLDAQGECLKVIEKNSGYPLYGNGSTVSVSFDPANIMQY